MEYTHMSFLYDFAFMSLLLIIAQFLRSHVKFLQMFYIPASVLAGIIGLLLGPQFLNVIPCTTERKVYYEKNCQRHSVGGKNSSNAL